jgi:hypothetical protein
VGMWMRSVRWSGERKEHTHYQRWLAKPAHRVRSSSQSCTISICLAPEAVWEQPGVKEWR